jgi:hypothetical protein
MNATQVGMGLARGTGQGQAQPTYQGSPVNVNLTLLNTILLVLIAFLLLFVELPIQ